MLDVGSGDVLLLQKFAEAGHNVTGIDPDPITVTQARSKLDTIPNVTVILGDVFDAPELLGQQFDLITAVASLRHLPLVPALRRLSELLAPGGELFVVGLVSNKSVTDWVISGALVIPVKLLSKAHGETCYPHMRTAEPQESFREIRNIATTVPTRLPHSQTPLLSIHAQVDQTVLRQPES